MSKLSSSLEEIAAKVKDYENLEQEKDVLKARCAELEEGAVELEKIKKKLLDARKTKKTLQKIEELEKGIENLTLQLDVKDVEIQRLKAVSDDNAMQVLAAELVNERMRYLAGKLGVKTNGRTVQSLISAVEDAVRKLR